MRGIDLVYIEKIAIRVCGDCQPESYRPRGQGRIAVLGCGVLQLEPELLLVELERAIEVADEHVHIRNLHRFHSRRRALELVVPTLPGRRTVPRIDPRLRERVGPSEMAEIAAMARGIGPGSSRAPHGCGRSIAGIDSPDADLERYSDSSCKKRP
jgi:hypothetical protein